MPQLEHRWARLFCGRFQSSHNERHAVGRRLLMSTRAQEALPRPGDHVTPLRELMSELLQNEQTRRHIVEMITSVENTIRHGL